MTNTRYLQGVHIQGVCTRCGGQEDISIYGEQTPQPDHVHVICLPCGLPTLYVKLPLERPSADPPDDRDDLFPVFPQDVGFWRNFGD